MEVLEGSQLAGRIHKLCSGNGKRRCAVAFWGKETPKLLFPNGTVDVEIILDVAMGGTTKAALLALGVPAASNVWALDGLHAKLYIGPDGAIVTSANASANALGKHFKGGRLHELGIWIDARKNKLQYLEVCKHFDVLKGKAHKAGKRDLERAPEIQPHFMNWAGSSSNRQSLLSLVQQNPQDFGGVLFIFGDSRAPRQDCLDAADAYEVQIKVDEALVNGSSQERPHRSLIAYYDVGENGKSRNAGTVVMYWRSGSQYHIRAYTDLVQIPVKKGKGTNFALFGCKDWRVFKRDLQIALDGNLEALAKADLAKARKLIGPGKRGDCWQEYSASELAEALSGT